MLSKYQACPLCGKIPFEDKELIDLSLVNNCSIKEKCYCCAFVANNFQLINEVYCVVYGNEAVRSLEYLRYWNWAKERVFIHPCIAKVKDMFSLKKRSLFDYIPLYYIGDRDPDEAVKDPQLERTLTALRLRG